MASPKKVVRPRYYSSELGIKDKLAVAVITSESLLSDYALSVNKTLAPHINKLLFFVRSDDSVSSDLPVVTFPSSLDISSQVSLHPYLLSYYDIMHSF